MTDMIANIAQDLLPLAFPIDKLSLLPGNANNGDIDGVAASYKKFKQRKPIVARKEEDGTCIVVAGNTQLQAARDRLGWTHIAVSWADDLNMKEAVGYALGDNNLGKKSETDREAELALLAQIEDDPIILDAAGYDLYDMQEIEALVELEEKNPFDEDEDDDEDDADDAPKTRAPGNAVVQYQLVFDDEDQQARWYAFLRWLKSEYPDKEMTAAGRVDKYLEGIVPE